MKTKEELNALKEEVEALNKKLHELTDDELAQVTGGQYPSGTTYGDFLTYGSGITYDKAYPSDYYTGSW